MKILILGSEGQIGKPFSILAKNSNHNIITFDKKLNSKFHDLANMEDNCLNYINDEDFDVCVFLAFEVGGSKFLTEKDKTFDYISENIRLMENCFSFLKRTKKPFLFASSQMSNMHHTNYGFLKDLGERYTKSLELGYICRFWNVYGYESPIDPKSHVITDFIHMAKKGKINMRTTGNEERQFLHTKDCSKALLHWCENYKNYDVKQYIDITSFQWTSVYEVASVIKKLIPCEIILGENIDLIQSGIKNEPSKYILNFWKPELSLQEGIKQLI